MNDPEGFLDLPVRHSARMSGVPSALVAAVPGLSLVDIVLPALARPPDSGLDSPLLDVAAWLHPL